MGGHPKHTYAPTRMLTCYNQRVLWREKIKKINNPLSVKREELHLELMLVMRLISSPANASKNKGGIMRLFSLVFNSIGYKSVRLFQGLLLSCNLQPLFALNQIKPRCSAHVLFSSSSFSFFEISTSVNDLEWLTIL